MTVTVTIRRLRKDAALPSYATAGAAGADLASAEEMVIPAGGRALVKTGIAIELPAGFEAQVRPRSGLALRHGVTVLNSPGTIDADFRGEVGVIAINHSGEDFPVKPGDRIAQLVIAPVVIAAFEEADSLSETDRGAGGFGSTGVASPELQVS